MHPRPINDMFVLLASSNFDCLKLCALLQIEVRGEPPVRGLKRANYYT